MTCASCGAENDAGRKFCLECGAVLAAACPSCGTANPPAAKFCGECGGPLAHSGSAGGAARPVPVPTPSRTAVAERRMVSVLFADLVGFTTLAESRDAEEVRDLLSRYFDLARGHRRTPRRHDREVHRGRRDGRLGRAHEPRGRRRARRAHGPGDRRRRPRTGVRRPGPRRRGDRRGRGDDRSGGRGDGRRGHGQHGESAAERGTSRRRARRRGDDARCIPRDRLRAGRRADAEGQGSRRSRPGAPCGSSPSGAGGVVPRRSRRPSWAATTSCGSSRTSTTPRQRDRRIRLVSVTGQGGIGKSRLAWEFLKYIDGLVDDGLLAPRALPLVRERDHVLGARRDGPRAGRARRDRRRGDHPRTDRGVRRPLGPGRSGAALDRGRRSSRCSASPTHRPAARTGSSRPGAPSSSGSPPRTRS